jgi:hypothetical protein
MVGAPLWTTREPSGKGETPLRVRFAALMLRVEHVPVIAKQGWEVARAETRPPSASASVRVVAAAEVDFRTATSGRYMTRSPPGARVFCGRPRFVPNLIYRCLLLVG